MPSPWLPELMDELVEEVLLRVPTDDPALLLRAALACKRWCRLVPGRRYRQLHRTPPVLGFVYNSNGINCQSTARFMPTSSFRPPRANLSNWAVIHSGHGHVLLVKAPVRNGTNQEDSLPRLGSHYRKSAGAALVFLAPVHGHGELERHSSLRLLGEQPLQPPRLPRWPLLCAVRGKTWRQEFKSLRGNGFYFKYHMRAKLLKYDLITQEMTVIHLPAESSRRRVVLMAMDDGRLGCTSLHGSKLYLWSRGVGFDTEARWSISRVIELEPLLPTGALISRPHLMLLAVRLCLELPILMKDLVVMLEANIYSRFSAGGLVVGANLGLVCKM
ncbi:hypothetical protein EJB05_14101, partial [Eragrostis curvula]